jgi:hypothetical protein
MKLFTAVILTLMSAVGWGEDTPPSSCKVVFSTLKPSTTPNEPPPLLVLAAPIAKIMFENFARA